MIEIQIKESEERLKLAMLNSDVTELDKLLGSDLVFTNHLGHVMTRQDDLNAHKSGVLKIKKITLSELKVTLYDPVAIVTVRAHIAGEFAGEVSDNHYRFTRVWRKTLKSAWQIIAGHSSIVT